MRSICAGRNQLDCPSCRVVTELVRAGGPDGLIINNHVVRLLEMTDSNSNPKVKSREDIRATACAGYDDEDSLSSALCVNCDNDSPDTAKWGCIDCAGALCDGCKIIHPTLKVLRNHRVLSVEDHRKHLSRMCARHPDQQITHVCDDCGVLICAMGALSCH